MGRVKTQLELDEATLGLVDGRAAASGRSRDEVIEDALRRQLQAGELDALLADVRQRSDLTDHEALALAYAELKSMRAERRHAS